MSRHLLVLAMLAAAWPGAAHADPVIVSAIISYGQAALAVAAGASAWVYAIATFATLNAAYQVRRQRRAERDARNAYNASLQDRQVMIRSGIAPQPLLYGRVGRVSGPVVFAHTSGDKKQYLHLVVALSGREVDAIEGVYFNEVLLPAPDGSGFITSGPYTRTVRVSAVASSATTTIVLAGAPYNPGQDLYVTDGGGEAVGVSIAGNVLTVTSPTFGPYVANYTYETPLKAVRIRTYTGAPGQVADPDLIAECGGKWTSAHIGTGVAYIYARLEWDQEIFGQVGLPNISAVVRGFKVRDPRTGLTQWSRNAALCTADYLRDATLGMACTAAEVPDAEITTAANISDELVTLDAGGATQARYTCDGVISTQDSARDNLAVLVDAMAGSAVWVQGRWLVRAGSHITPTVTLTESHLAGGAVRIIPRAARAGAFNRVTGTFIDPGQLYAAAQFPEVKNATYVAADGGLDLVRDIPMPMVTDAKRAQRLAKIELERARQALTVQITANWRAYDLAPSDTVALTLARYGWSGKAFVVRDREIGPDGIAYTLQETASGIYAWAYGEATTVDLAPNTTLPDPFATPAALTGLAAVSGTAQLQRLADGSIITRALVTWAQSTDTFVVSGGAIQVQWKRDDAQDWQSAGPVPGADASTMIGPLDDSRLTLIRVRPINSAGRTGPWSTISHVVIGKTTPPSNVASISYTSEQFGVRLTWPAVADLDVAEYELRYGGTSWETSLPLDGGTTRIRSTSYEWRLQAAGSRTVYVKAVDTTGNYSTTAASTSVVIAAPGEPAVTYALAGPDEIISWTASPAQFAVAEYEVRYGTSYAAGTFLARTKGTQLRRQADFDGARTYWVAAIDVANNTGAAGRMDLSITAPGVPTSARSETVGDATVLLRWSPPATGSLPVDRYEVRKGATFAGAAVIGSAGNVGFTSVLEQTGGTFTYWVVAINTAGTYGTPVSVPTTVVGPSDYVLRVNIDSTFSGTKTNMFPEMGALVGPVDTTRTWAQHFTDGGWTTPQQQVDAGYPIYAQPGLGSGSYQEEFDYGATLGATTIIATLGSVIVAGSVTVACQIDYKLNSGDSWTAGAAGATQILANNFRYVRVTWTFTCTAGVNLIKVTSFNLKLAAKLKTDSGEATSTTGALTVNFNVAFIQANVPIVQPQGLDGASKPYTPAVIFAGGPNPTSFQVRIYDSTGAQPGGVLFGWTARGY